jgi:hypothetical protein
VHREGGVAASFRRQVDLFLDILLQYGFFCHCLGGGDVATTAVAYSF